MRNKLVSPRLLLLWSTTFLPIAASAVDDSVWINQGIAEAIKQGKSEYVIPSGSYEIENPIRIPSGTSNFRLSGNGIDQTIITTPNKRLGAAIYIGLETVLHNNWGINNRDNYSVSNVPDGSTALRLADGQKPVEPGYYVLWDNSAIVKDNGVDQSMNHAEIVYVSGYNNSTKMASLTVPVGREYNVRPSLADFRSYICSNIEISDLGFDGSVNDGTYSNSFVSSGVCDGLTLARLKVRNYVTGAISVNLTRNTLIESTDVGGATNFGPGGGYGVAVYRSRFVTIRNCKDWLARHSFILHSGTMDTLLEGCSTEVGGYDTHGYDERRIEFRNCTGNGINLGNDGYMGGGRDFLVNGCDLQGGVDCHPNIRGVFVRNSTLTGTGFSYRPVGSTKGSPSGGFADQLFFDNCTFRSDSSSGLIGNSTFVGQVTFRNCVFDFIRTDWGVALKCTEWQKGSLSFVNCEFISHTGGYLVELDKTSKQFRLQFIKCRFASTGPAIYAVRILKDFRGTIVSNSNVFRSYRTSGLQFSYDDSGRYSFVNRTARTETIK